jgi:hypothetical protein
MYIEQFVRDNNLEKSDALPVTTALWSHMLSTVPLCRAGAPLNVLLPPSPSPLLLGKSPARGFQSPEESESHSMVK